MIMPEMGGKETFRVLKEINPSVKVVLSSGYSLSGEVQQLVDEGVRAFIGKPYDLHSFSEVLSNVLNK